MQEFRSLLSTDGSFLINNFRPVQPIAKREVQFTLGQIPETSQAPPNKESSAISWSYMGSTGKTNYECMFQIIHNSKL